MPRRPRANTRKPAAEQDRLSDQYLDPGCQGSRVERRLDEKLLKQGWWFDKDEADRVCQFFEEHIRHVEGEWQGQLIVLADWQRRLLRRAFGWRRPDGTRRYRRVHVWIPKKNGKSLLISGICLYGLTWDNEPGAKIFCCATNEEQAMLVFNVAKQMVEMDPMLDEELTVFTSSIYYPELMSRYEVVSSKPSSKHGLNIQMMAYDEIHAAGDRALYDVMSMGAGASRRQPLELVISTAGDNLASIGYELWESALKARDGILEDPEFLQVVFAADPEDDWRSEATWAKANPTYPVSPKKSALESDLAKCELTPSMIPAFKQLHLNIWTQAATAAIDIERWKRCYRKNLVARKGLLFPERLEGRRCWGGMDLSSTNDLTSFALAFPWDDEQGIDLLVWHWVPEENVAERAKRHRVDYPAWIQAGHLFATPGNVVDYTAVEEFIVRCSETVDLQDIGYDPRNAQDLVQRLQDNRGITMVTLNQHFANLSGATKELERLYLSRHLGHNGNPVLTWQASHVIWKTNPSGDIMPDKKKSREKIDGIAASVMAIARVSMGRKDVSQLETGGLPTV